MDAVGRIAIQPTVHHAYARMPLYPWQCMVRFAQLHMHNARKPQIAVKREKSHDDERNNRVPLFRAAQLATDCPPQKRENLKITKADRDTGSAQHVSRETAKRRKLISELHAFVQSIRGDRTIRDSVVTCCTSVLRYLRLALES